MKRILTILFLLASLQLNAQKENAENDFGTIRQTDFKGFIIDMSAMLNSESLNLPVWDLGLLTPPATKPIGTFVAPEAYTFKSALTYLGSTSSPLPSFQSILYPGAFGAAPVQWQGASYRLNNGIRINTYGEYDANGYKRVNPAALPWQRNNFNAAFEVKSPDGKFGIKVEVHQGGGY